GRALACADPQLRAGAHAGRGIGGRGPCARIAGERSAESRGRAMCRNIRVLANFDPPATDEEVRASALQFVRKLSGAAKPSKANEAAFWLAVDEVTATARKLIDALETSAAPRNREAEAAKAKARAELRYA